MTGKVGRNDPYPCRSERTYKKAVRRVYEKDFHYRHTRNRLQCSDIGKGFVLIKTRIIRIKSSRTIYSFRLWFFLPLLLVTLGHAFLTCAATLVCRDAQSSR